MSSASFTQAQPELSEGRRHHADGNLLQAAEAYRRALRSHPQSQSALLGLSLIARQSNQLVPALRMAQAALAAGSRSAVAWANLGDSLQSLHQTAAAESAFCRAIALESTLAVAHYGLGNAFAIQEEFSAALAHFQTAMRLSPGVPEFHFACGFAHGKLGEHAQAIAAYRRGVQLRPSYAAAWLNLGVELVADGRDQFAQPCYRQALASCYPQNPAHLQTWISARLNLGHLARSRRNFSEGAEHYGHAYTMAARESPLRLAEIQVAFTYLHLEQQQFGKAWQSLRLAEDADTSRNPEIPNARGILLLAEDAANAPEGPICALTLESPADSGPAAAISAFEVAEAQGHKTASSNRGNALLRLGRCEEALAAHQAALRLDPCHPGVRYNLALTQLRVGDFAQGWPNYEIRWSFREVHPRPRRFTQPRWQGEPFSDLVNTANPSNTLFIYGEQGLGDTIQFIRYLQLVAERITGKVSQMWDPAAAISGHVLLELQPPLIRLLTPFVHALANSHPGLAVEVIASGDSLPRFTHHCPLLSLPYVFQTKLETVPASTAGQPPYLQADPELTALRAGELANCDPDFPKIGVAWAGNPNYRADRERSTRLQTFMPLLEIPTIHWVSLQKGEPASHIAEIQNGRREQWRIYDGSSGDRDLADTAALIANLDLVITTDTAVAHLAGALGKPMWLLLPWQSDWRWMQDRLTTPWYPTARLFRQSSPGNWTELIARVAKELQTPKNCRKRLIANLQRGPFS